MRKVLISIIGICLVLTSAGVIFLLKDSWNGSGPTPQTAQATTVPTSTATNPEPTPKVSLTPDEPSQPNWLASFAQFEQSIGGAVGIAVAPIGASKSFAAGSLKSGVAWSTSKVPVAIAAVRKDGENPEVLSQVRSAITVSDNRAAEALYDRLGPPKQASAKVEQVLRDGKNSQVRVPTTRLRAGFTIFGQTQWSTADQAVFAANLGCISNHGPVTTQMGRISGGQRWGLGRLDGAVFKGGWGPVSGGYLNRQMGVVTIKGQPLGVAIITLRPSHEQGQQVLSQIADWLAANVEPLPGAHNSCESLNKPSR